MTDVRGAGPAGSTEVGAGWGWIMAYGIVSVLLGILAFAAPFAATFAATVVIGIFFFVSGAFAIAAALFGRGSAHRGYTILFGALSVIVGLIMVLEPATGALSLTLLVAVWLGVRGVLELVYGFRLKRRRGMLIALGIINVLLALFILATVPFSALTLPGYILGISFIFGGITSITAAADHRKGASAFAVPG
ncbi:HdeD family acid-resistance protein [Sphingomonas sp.]|uniref:HdeD family acid-resistance protein n=1 Tax=Sphingomonas sp. TaxID=28214 RepID=UPI0035C7D657